MTTLHDALQSLLTVSHIHRTNINLSTPNIPDRDPRHASSSYDSPRFAWRSSGVSFTSRRSDPRGYSPSYSQDRDAKQYDESSSFDSRQGNSLVAVNESSDEGELHPVNRFVCSFAIKANGSLHSTIFSNISMSSHSLTSMGRRHILSWTHNTAEQLAKELSLSSEHNALCCTCAAKFLMLCQILCYTYKCRSVSSRTRNKGPARDIKTISASIKALTSKANVAAAMK